MEKENLNSIMNYYKNAGFRINDDMKFLDIVISEMPFHVELLDKEKTFMIMEYNVYVICIDALMEMIDYQQGRTLTKEQLEKINLGAKSYAFSPIVMEYVAKIDEEYGIPFDYDEETYLMEINMSKGKRKMYKKIPKKNKDKSPAKVKKLNSKNNIY